MALRTTTLAATTPAAAPKDWRERVEDALAAAGAAIRAGDVARVAAIYADVAGWDERQRAYQARRQLTELVFSAGTATAESWLDLYAAAAGALLDALEDEPREPTLLNYAGVLLYELTELGGADALF